MRDYPNQERKVHNHSQFSNHSSIWYVGLRRHNKKREEDHAVKAQVMALMDNIRESINIGNLIKGHG